MIVQIYEIQRPQDAERCIELGVDHVGSVLLSESDWRRPQLRETIRVTRQNHVKSSLIPLFHDLETLGRVIEYYQPHFIHFCENLTDDSGREESLDLILSIQSTIKERYPELGIIRSIPIPRKGTAPEFPTLRLAKVLEPTTDIFLTDTWLGREPVEGFIGITGWTCDWGVAKKLVRESKIPVIFAGGLSPENVYKGVTEVAPAGADSCTHTNQVDREGRPIRFEKDFDKVKRFVDEVRRAEKVVPFPLVHPLKF